jgi:hypothetical protein
MAVSLSSSVKSSIGVSEDEFRRFSGMAVLSILVGFKEQAHKAGEASGVDGLDEAVSSAAWTGLTVRSINSIELKVVLLDSNVNTNLFMTHTLKPFGQID